MSRTWRRGRSSTGRARPRGRGRLAPESNGAHVPVEAPPSRTVAIVLDPAFAAALPALAGRASVWVVDTPENRPAIESLWTARRTRAADYDVTVFRMIPGLSPESHVDGVVRSVEKQHDPEEPTVIVATIEVHGAPLSDGMRSTFEAHGYTRLEPFADGFRASREEVA